MNQEIQEFLQNILAQIIAGVPIGALLSLVVHYALNRIKRKTAEFPEKAQQLETKVVNYSKSNLYVL